MTLEPIARLNLTKELLGGIRVPKTPPKGFNPLSANAQTLSDHGLPPKPDKETYPQHYDKWVQLMSHAQTFISPEFEIMEHVPAPETIEEGGAKKGSPRWSGAVLIDVDSDDPIQRVEGSWTVPKAYPLTSAWTPWGWENKKYKSGTWVGIDGYHTKNAHVLQGGTAERCVVSPRQTMLQPTYAWVEWVPAYPIWFANFEVRSGDLVTCSVEAISPDEGVIRLFNRSTCNYSIAYLPKPPKGLPIEGKTAEWIVEGPEPQHTESDTKYKLDTGGDSEGEKYHVIHEQPWSDHTWRTPYLGATFIYDCTATTKGGEVRNLKDAILVDQVQDGVLLNTAVKENDNMVGIFSAPTWPVWTEIDEVHVDTS